MREAKCKTCKKVFEAPPKGPLPPNCPKHRFLSVCKSCNKSFNGTFRVEVLCPKCRTSQKPCAECGNEFSPSPKGKVSPLCEACRKRKQMKQSVQFNKKRTLDVNPIKPCVDCGGVVPLLQTKRYIRCESCMELHKKKFEVDRRAEQKANDPHFDRRRDLKRKYGMTLEDWDELFESQNRSCKICGTDSPGGKGFWHVDHDHTTNEVRGILCNGCNTGLGHFKDSLENLKKAQEYLKANKKK